MRDFLNLEMEKKMLVETQYCNKHIQPIIKQLIPEFAVNGESYRHNYTDEKGKLTGRFTCFYSVKDYHWLCPVCDKQLVERLAPKKEGGFNYGRSGRKTICTTAPRFE